MNIVVLVKQVPDTYSERKLAESDHTLDRESTDAVIDEINERSVEAALQLKEAGEGEVTVVCMGPDRATEAIRKALSMGADKAVHLSDEALHGSCAVQTAKALAKVIGTVGDYDLIIAGNEASDGRTGAVPAMVAEVLGIPALTHAQELSVDGTTVTVTRGTDDGITKLTASLPAPSGTINPFMNNPGELGFPVVVKPDGQGSSLGVGFAADLAQLADRIAEARRFDKQLLVEKWIDGREFTVAVAGRRPCR